MRSVLWHGASCVLLPSPAQCAQQHGCAWWLRAVAPPINPVTVRMTCVACLLLSLQLGGPELAGVGQPPVAGGCGLPQGPLLHADALQVSNPTSSYTMPFGFLWPPGVASGAQRL